MPSPQSIPDACADLVAPPRQVRAYATRWASISPAHPAVLQGLALALQITGRAGTTLLVGDLDDPAHRWVLSGPSAARLALAQVLGHLDLAELCVLPVHGDGAGQGGDVAVLSLGPAAPRRADLPRDLARVIVLPGQHLPASLVLERNGGLFAELASADVPVMFLAHGPAHAAAVHLALGARGLRLASIAPSLPDAELLIVRAVQAPHSPEGQTFIDAVLEAMHETDGFPAALVHAGTPRPETPDLVDLQAGYTLSLRDRRIRLPGAAGDDSASALTPPLPLPLFYARPQPDAPVAARWIWLYAVAQWLDDHLVEDAVHV